MNSNFFQTQTFSTTLPASRCDPLDDMLIEVDFKWLMAGHGWWIDADRFHSDSSYAAHWLKLAEASDMPVLKKSAAQLQPQHRLH